IKKVTQDIEADRFNTAIAAMMEATNGLYKTKDNHTMSQSETWRFAIESLLQLLAPFAPHASEELWHQLGHADTIHVDHWPNWDEKYLVTDTKTIVVQVNGKLRANVEVSADANEDTVLEAAKSNEKVASHLEGQAIKKTIYVPNKLVNFVVQ